VGSVKGAPDRDEVKARLVVAVALAVSIFGAAIPARGAPVLRNFSYRGTGTNQVTLLTGELRELWKGRAKPFGRITTHVAGFIQRPDPRSLTVHASMVIADPSGDVLIGVCTGTGILPNPDGQEDWTCDATGGTGKFETSTGQWKLHIDIHRISLANGVQKNRFTEKASGRISGKPRRG
jgi:hypothetical protein